MPDGFTAWAVRQGGGLVGSRLRAVVEDERARSTLDECAVKALRGAVLKQRRELADDALESAVAGLRDVLWGPEDSLPLSDDHASLWERLEEGLTARFAVLDDTEADETGRTQAEAMGLESAALAFDFLRGFYRELEQAVLQAATDRRLRVMPDDDLTIRLQLCGCDISGDWEQVTRSARRGAVSPPLAALVFARLGRHHAWRAEPEEADDAYREAIVKACAAELWAEAGHAMRSLQRLQWVYAVPSEQWEDMPHLAERVESAGGGSLVERRRDPLDAGLVELAAARLPSAVRHLRTSLRDHVLAGHLEGELSAHDALTLAFRQFDVGGAVEHAIRAGKVKELKGLLPADRYLPVDEHLQSSAPWQRAAALVAVARQADLVPDGEVERLAADALGSTAFVRQGPLGPQVWADAWKVVAALAPRLTTDQARDALARLTPHIERGPGQYRFNDDQHVEVVAAIYETQRELREAAGTHLLALLAQGDQLAETVRQRAARALGSEPEVIAPELRRLVDDGNDVALRLLFDMDQPHPRLVERAETAVERTLSRPPDPPGAFSFGTDMGRTAYLARILGESRRVELARHLAAFARSVDEPEVNRADAVVALRPLADTLPSDLRDELFEFCLGLVEDPGPPNEIDSRLRAGLHPLSTFRIDLGWGALAGEAALTASFLAQHPKQYGRLVDAARPLLFSASQLSVHRAALALAQLPPEYVDLDLEVLAGLVEVAARQLAAVLWVRHSPECPEVGRALARDSDVRVRRSLGSGLHVLADTDAHAAITIAETLDEDPCWSVRTLARSFDGRTS